MKIPHTIPPLVLRFFAQEKSIEKTLQDGRIIRSEDFSWDIALDSMKKTLANQCLEFIIKDFVELTTFIDELNRIGAIRHEEDREQWEEDYEEYLKRRESYHLKLEAQSEKGIQPKDRAGQFKFADDDDDEGNEGEMGLRPPKPIPASFPPFAPIRSILDLLNDSDRIRVVEELDFKAIPLEIAIRTIPDEHYWERASVERWPTAFASEHENSWRTLFMEKHITDAIEGFHPFESDYEKLMEQANLVAPYVKQLSFNHLIPSCFGVQLKEVAFIPFEHDEETTSKEEDEGFHAYNEVVKLGLDVPETDHVDTEGEEEEGQEEEISPERDNSHIDFSLILPRLTHLTKLSLVYEMQEMGMDWEQRYFEFTDLDCENLAKALRQCHALEIFEFNRSSMTGEQCEILVKDGISQMTNLRSLNLSYQNIGDSGAKAIANLLKGNPSIQSLILARNQIKNKGAKAIAEAFTINERLCKLDLRLNLFGDKSGKEFAQALLKNKTLWFINLAANRLTEKSAEILGEMIFHNTTLREIDLSSNELGKNGGHFLALGVRGNSSILKVDLRLTGVGLGVEYGISQQTKKNMMRAKISVLERDVCNLDAKKKTIGVKDGEDDAEEEIELD